MLFSAFQKVLVGEIHLLLNPRASLVPFFYGGIVGVVFGIWYRRLRQKEHDLIASYDMTIAGWAKAIELRDRDTQDHSLRVANMTEELARQLGISESKIEHIRRGALLHDIGKIAVSDSILLKKGFLTSDERKEVKKHPLYAYEMLKEIAFLKPALPIPLYHHECWNGSGYPYEYKEEEIPLEARIFAVVDCWDALTSDRPYRKAWSEKKALVYIRENAGIRYDPNVVDIFYDHITSRRTSSKQRKTALEPKEASLPKGGKEKPRKEV